MVGFLFMILGVIAIKVGLGWLIGGFGEAMISLGFKKGGDGD